MIGFDFASWQGVDPAGLVAAGGGVVLVYMAPNRYEPSGEFIQSCHDAGLGVVFIGESYATRAYEGYNAGLADAGWWDVRATVLGYPPECVIYYVLGDTNGADEAAHVGPISDYVRGLSDASGRDVIGVYGGRAAIDAARAASPKVQRAWGVETWGPWDGTDLDLMQIANTPSPVGGTDWDQMFRDDVGQWPRPSAPAPPVPPAPPQPKETEPMTKFLGRRIPATATAVYLYNFGTMTRTFIGLDGDEAAQEVKILLHDELVAAKPPLVSELLRDGATIQVHDELHSRFTLVGKDAPKANR